MHTKRDLDLPVAWWAVQKQKQKNSLNMTATRAGHVKRALKMDPLNTFCHFLLLNPLPHHTIPRQPLKNFWH